MTRARVEYEMSFRYGGVIFQAWATFFAYLRERILSLAYEMTPAPTLGFRLNAQIGAKLGRIATNTITLLHSSYLTRRRAKVYRSGEQAMVRSAHVHMLMQLIWKAFVASANLASLCNFPALS
jgi:hypothetical protein